LGRVNLGENLIQIRQIKRSASKWMRAFFYREVRYLVFWIGTRQILACWTGILRHNDDDIFNAWIGLHTFKRLSGLGGLPHIF